MKKKIDEKRAITPRWVIKFTSKFRTYGKIAGFW
jgi:hypothetical protein